MDIIFGILGIYLVCGVVAIALLDLTTKRVRRRLKSASADTMMVTGGGTKVAMAVTIIALWLFWPWAIYAAFKG